MGNPDHIQLTLWGAGTARTLRPIWVAEELGLEYRLEPIGPRTGETKTEDPVLRGRNGQTFRNCCDMSLPSGPVWQRSQAQRPRID